MSRPPDKESALPTSSRAALLEIASLLEEATRHLTLLAHDLEAYEAQRLAKTDPQFAEKTAATLRMAMQRANKL